MIIVRGASGEQTMSEGKTGEPQEHVRRNACANLSSRGQTPACACGALCGSAPVSATPLLEELSRQLCLPASEASLESLRKRGQLVVRGHLLSRIFEPQLLLHYFFIGHAVLSDELFHIRGSAVQARSKATAQTGSTRTQLLCPAILAQSRVMFVVRAHYALFSGAGTARPAVCMLTRASFSFCGITGPHVSRGSLWGCDCRFRRFFPGYRAIHRRAWARIWGKCARSGMLLLVSARRGWHFCLGCPGAIRIRLRARHRGIAVDRAFWGHLAGALRAGGGVCRGQGVWRVGSCGGLRSVDADGRWRTQPRPRIHEAFIIPLRFVASLFSRYETLALRRCSH